ncbi:MAG: UvrD-helicase domain-containing protein [Candidatus Omnitrophota bacterium]
MSINQSQTISSPEVVIVEASAGSGKTYALAKRYIQLLINPGLKINQIPLQNILAITFTNKATIEMKERILELLKKIAFWSFSGVDEEKDMLSVLRVDREHAQSKASHIMDTIIRNYNSFQVYTIDSFINALLLGCAFHIDRSAHFSIKHDYSQYLSYCLDMVIDEAKSDKKVFEFFEEFLQHYIFVQHKTGWFPKDDILKFVKSLFNLSNKYGGSFGIYPADTADIMKSKALIYKQVKDFSEYFPEGINLTAKKSLTNFIKKDNPFFELKDLPGVLSGQIPPMKKNAALPLNFERRWKKTNSLVKNTAQLEANIVFNPYVMLFRGMLGYFQQVCKKDDIIFLQELNRKAGLLFGPEGVTVAELYWRLSTRFSHYLIDELQDTSILQWHNIRIMIEEALSKGGTLFCVGDKKQAIYRFRGGERGLFEKVKKEFSIFNIKQKHLTKNWRSQKAVVEFNNIVFSKSNLQRALNESGIIDEISRQAEAKDAILESFTESYQLNKEENDAGYVSVSRIEEKSQRERNRIIKTKIISLVGELKERFYCRDIAILARDNNEVEMITSWLLEAKIPAESEKTLNVLEHGLIKEIIALLRFLYSPIDDLSFASFILGDIFANAAGVNKKESTSFLFELNIKRQAEGCDSLYREFRKKYAKVWEDYIEGLFKEGGFKSVYDLLIDIYQRFRVFDIFLKNQAFFMKFLELAAVKEDEYTGLGQFLTYIKSAPSDDIYVNVTSSDSVKILTIHKSKGLEFPAVIIPFLRMDISPSVGEKDSNLHISADEHGNVSLLRITKANRRFSPELEETFSRDYANACIDELNAMYVALTRAKHELYLFISQKSGLSNNKACYFIPAEIKSMGKKRQVDTVCGASKHPVVNIPASIYKNWVDLLKGEFIDIREFINRQAIKEGIFYHSALSQIENLRSKNTDEAIKEAIKFALAKHPNVSNVEYFKDKTKNIIESGALRDIFYISQGFVFCEKEIADRSGNLKIIDRLIVKKSQVWVIDYKSSHESADAAHHQVKDYMSIISQIYPDKTIKGFVIYIDDEALEEVDP